MNKKTFDRLLHRAKGGDVESLLRLGEYYLEHNNTDSALYWLRQADDRSARARELVEQLTGQAGAYADPTPCYLNYDDMVSKPHSNSRIGERISAGKFIAEILAGIFTLGIYWPWRWWSDNRWIVGALQSINAHLFISMPPLGKLPMEALVFIEAELDDVGVWHCPLPKTQDGQSFAAREDHESDYEALFHALQLQKPGDVYRLLEHLERKQMIYPIQNPYFEEYHAYGLTVEGMETLDGYKSSR